jgi:hypothetical protein
MNWKLKNKQIMKNKGFKKKRIKYSIPPSLFTTLERTKASLPLNGPMGR